MNMAQILVNGNFFTINSATYTGSQSASGIIAFPCGHYLGSSGASPLSPSNTGVVLTTGSAALAMSLVNTATSSSSSNVVAGSTYLSSLVGRATFDASTLTMTLTSKVSGSVAMDYVFGSEEYLEYAGSQYDDIFALTINGVNKALLPTSLLPVSINTVNAGRNADFFAYNPLNISYDGVTNNPGGSNPNLSTIPFPVSAGQTITVVIAIADTADAIYDSVVFVTANSIRIC